MNFSVNAAQKNRVEKRIYWHRPRVLIMRLFAFAMLILAICGIISLIKSDGDILGMLGSSVGISLFFAFVALARGLTGLEAKWRLQETLFIKNDEIHYIYALHNFSEDAGKFVVVIPFDRLEKTVYDAKTEGLTFYGKIYSGYTDKPAVGDMVIDQGKMKKYVIHDYFKPGLKNELKKAGIAIQKG